MTSILFDKIEGIGKITLNRPEVYNSFNREMALALQDRLDECVADDHIRAVMILGSGNAFSAGQDLNEVTNPDENPGFQVILHEHFNPIIRRIREAKMPVIAAVNGVAAGAGANIALACDIVIATESASFIQAFSKIGLIPDSGGTFFLPRLVGFQKALAITLLGDKITAQEAAQMGMIYKAVADHDFERYIWHIAHTLAAMPTKGLWLTKRAFNKSLNNSLNEQLDFEEKLQIKAGETEDYREGVAAFLEKRPPLFTGK
ncbi:MAG: enoyl-CoA hydratase-related protein [Bacteroidia bacterium]|nr:enoyl-CoA hydratase-related protein [Bacteroidia bacterium]